MSTERYEELTDGVGISGHVRATVLDAETHEILDVQETKNATSIELHEYIARNLNPAIDENEYLTHLAVGSNGDPADPSQRQLNQPIPDGQTTVTSVESRGAEISADTYIGSGEFNGETIQEIGLLAGEVFVNRATLQPIEKTPARVAMIEVTITFVNV